MSNVTLIIAGVIVYLVVAYLASLWHQYDMERTGDYGTSPWVSLLWPLLLLLMIVYGPYEFVRDLGIKARIARLEKERREWAEKNDRS